MIGTGLEEQLRALREGSAFLRPAADVTSVGGADAERWLNDLLTARVEGLPEGRSVRSLVLSPTGRIRADVQVLHSADRFLLVQALDQPERVREILGPYVLSSSVELEPADAIPVLLAAEDGWLAAAEPPAGALEVGPEAAEAWRVSIGLAAFPIDLVEGSLPAEAGLDVPPVTETAKGCFLGQESVARVRNLGHPTRTVRALAAGEPVRAGERVVAGDRSVGAVTSSITAPRGSLLLARVAWEARDAPLRTPAGTPLEPR
jgi:folate-binding protein YgfZ